VRKPSLEHGSEARTQPPSECAGFAEKFLAHPNSEGRHFRHIVVAHSGQSSQLVSYAKDRNAQFLPTIDIRVNVSRTGVVVQFEIMAASWAQSVP